LSCRRLAEKKEGKEKKERPYEKGGEGNFEQDLVALAVPGKEKKGRGERKGGMRKGNLPRFRRRIDREKKGRGGRITERKKVMKLAGTSALVMQGKGRGKRGTAGATDPVRSFSTLTPALEEGGKGREEGEGNWGRGGGIGDSKGF